MDADRFDTLTRSLFGTNRRRLLGAAFGGVMALVGGGGIAKKKNKKPALNQFGCLNIGQKCSGKDGLCCSGVCGGKKPKKGKSDKRKCEAHNTNGCAATRSACVTDSLVKSLCNPPDVTAVCFATTGNAGFCGSALGFAPATHCQLCTRDTDCEAAGFAPGSACVFFTGGLCEDPCAATEGRACFPPAVQDGG